MKKVLTTGLLVMFLAASTMFTGCGGVSTPTTQEADQKIQEDVLARGQAAEPPYQVKNFLSRNAINEWLKRMDTTDKLWYVYEYADSGAVLGYYISRTVPLSYGVSLTSPAKLERADLGEWGGDMLMPAPGLDAIFYGGVDEDLYFFFDAETDTLIMTNNRLKVMDAPLDIDAPLFRVKVTTNED